jgi:heat shock protein HslJ
MRRDRLVALGCALFLTACASGGVDPTAAGADPSLTGTTWRLVEFRSNDDRIGVVRPGDGDLYTMTLDSDGRTTMRIDCNQGFGNWAAEPGDGDSGAFTFGPLSMTKVYCGPDSMDQRIARDAQYIRTYLLRDGRLYLDLMADGGTYVWEPATPSR